MKKILVLSLSIMMIMSLFTFQVHAEDIYAVIPNEMDYVVSNSTITGLKKEYIDSLDINQKQNIKLILPDTINGKAITAIGNNAFKSSDTYRLIYIDISHMSTLKTIGDWAFYSNTSMQGNIVLPDSIENISTHAFDICPSLTGDLVLPNSLKTIGTYAFSGSKGMKGNLTLSNQLKVISNYAFKDAGFTGSLNIPSSVEKISDSAFRQGNPYNGFAGKLIIPDSVTVVENVAFSYQDGITDVQFSKNMTSIPTSMFRNCKGLSGVLEIPDHIQSIGANAFTETNLKTIYLPEMINQNNSNFIVDSPFYNCPNLTAIVCKQKDYETIKPLLAKYSTVQKKLTYETEIKLQDEKINVYNPLLKLYNFSYQYVKQSDKSWKIEKSYLFPQVIGNTNNTKWSITQNSRQPVYETELVGQEKILYAIETYDGPSITYGGNIDKKYDGLPARLSVNAMHPKYVNISDATQGDIVFYYTWKWSTIGGDEVVQKGYDLNTLDLTDVYNPTYPIACTVYLQACYIDNNKAVPYFTELHNFLVDITQADSIVHPIYEKTIQYVDGLPEIKLSTGDTKGTISWDSNQTLQEGVHLYKWTFTPESNQVGSSNYTTIKGDAEINALNPKIFHINVKDNGNGKVSPGYSYQVTQGEKTSLSITPDLQYTVSSLKINGKECLSQLVNNLLNIEDVQSDYMIEIKFDKVSVDNVEDIIDELPKIPENQKPTQEQVTSILEAKLSYENLGSLKDDLSEETKKEFNELLMKLPQIEIETESQLVDSSLLLDNMSIEDIEVLLNDPDATLSIHCDMTPVANDSVEDDIKDYTQKMIISNYFDIQMIKVISSQGNDSQTILSDLKSPIQLVLAIPPNLPPITENCQRKYYIIRVHEVGENKEITVLNNESQNNSNIVVSTDKFSIYAIAYVDVENSVDTDLPIIITPNESPYFNDSLSNDKLIITNDEQDITIWLVLGLGSLVVALIFLFSKKKKA